ncbi:hypothetical protein AAFF_G00042530 [Aldrovandia affinis]|uniref:Kelch domain-containing protein 8B n=1 Tax=Aldrovandia affinis TaxID=143900 RepID=A0AAD7S2S4_9TELE|nr:hypothetical protein AAFF_G00042530 [Aldrovandia affinis]
MSPARARSPPSQSWGRKPCNVDAMREQGTSRTDGSAAAASGRASRCQSPPSYEPRLPLRPGAMPVPEMADGLLYVLGGCSETGLPLDTAEALDLASQTWTQLPPLPTARAGASAVTLGSRLLVIGGMDTQQSPLSSVEIYNPDEGKWERKASLAQPSMGITSVEKGKRETRTDFHTRFLVGGR